jgi:hypothetical protein
MKREKAGRALSEGQQAGFSAHGCGHSCDLPLDDLLRHLQFETVPASPALQCRRADGPCSRPMNAVTVQHERIVSHPYHRWRDSQAVPCLGAVAEEQQHQRAHHGWHHRGERTPRRARNRPSRVRQPRGARQARARARRGKRKWDPTAYPVSAYRRARCGQSKFSRKKSLQG